MTERRWVMSLAAGVLAALIACGPPYLVDNPYDNNFPVIVTITGPDTLFSYQEQGTYTATSDPLFPDSAFIFQTSDDYLLPGAQPTYTSNAPPLYPAFAMASVVVGLGAIDTQNIATGAFGVKKFRHYGIKNVYLTQRVTHIQLRCPDTHACAPLSVGGTWSVWVDGTDARNEQILALFSAASNPSTGTPVATFVSRDTSIASAVPIGIRVASVTAMKPGSTWIVAARGSLLDSLQLVVH